VAASRQLSRRIEGRYTLVSPKPVDADHDPSRYDLFPTDTLKIGGEFFQDLLDCEWPWRADCSGWAHRKSTLPSAIQTSPHLRADHRDRPLLRPEKRAWSFMDPLNADQNYTEQASLSLAADFDAPTALLVARERPERLGLSRS